MNSAFGIDHGEVSKGWVSTSVKGGVLANKSVVQHGAARMLKTKAPKTAKKLTGLAEKNEDKMGPTMWRARDQFSGSRTENYVRRNFKGVSHA